VRTRIYLYLILYEALEDERAQVCYRSIMPAIIPPQSTPCHQSCCAINQYRLHLGNIAPMHVLSQSTWLQCASPHITINQLKYCLHSCTTGNIAPKHCLMANIALCFTSCNIVCPCVIFLYGTHCSSEHYMLICRESCQMQGKTYL